VRRISKLYRLRYLLSSDAPLVDSKWFRPWFWCVRNRKLMPTPSDVLWQEPQLRHLAPLVLAAWRDGHLTPAELLAIRETLERASWLSESARTAVLGWLNPDAPPSPRALCTLEREVSGWLSVLPNGQRRTLSALAAALVSGNVADSQVHNALTLLASVGDTFTEEELETSTSPVERTARPPRAPSDRVSEAEHAQLRAWLDGPQARTRDGVRALLGEPEFRAVQELGTAAYREQVLSWLRRLIERGTLAHCFPKGLSEGREVARFVATFETLALFDQSLVVKFGVQAGLFAGAIEALGTRAHHGLLTSALKGELLGCFAMTERGHGSNVRGLLTTARYEPESESFVISTPGLAAGKEWIGNAAAHARMAVVFAQLETLGEGYGVHAFLVPIRRQDGTPEQGVRIEDCGHKMGLNGVDNGRLWFDDVRVPRSALLDRFGQVDPDGQYQSKIPSSSKRFFTMLGTLVGGRIAIAGAAVSASKVGLTIAIRYGLARTQFADADGREIRLFDYLSHQRRLLPPLAAAYAYTFAQAELVRRASEVDAEGVTRPDVETLAAGLKALSTWQAVATLQQCRESCGGQGYLTSNRIDGLRTDTDVFTTFEGDNTVLLQLVANNLLRIMRGMLHKRPVSTVLKSLVEDVVIAVQERNPIALRADSSESLRSFELHATALRFREKTLLASLARRVSRRIEDGLSPQQAFDACQDHGISLARAHIETYVLGCFQAVARDQPLLEPLCALYGLSRIEADLAWFLENDFMAPPKSRAVRDQVNELVREIAPRALDLVDAFAIPPSCLGPLADSAYLGASGLVRESES
jgi:acyl-CoA oxidase